MNIMTAIANALNALGDLLSAPFGHAAALAVAVLSAVTGVIMLLLFKWSTNQDQLVAARQVLTGRIYEMGLYQDHLSVLGKIQRDLAVANLKYLRWSLPALLVVALPMVLILAQMDAHYGHRPLVPGETALVTVQLETDQVHQKDGLRLEADPGVLVETRPLRDLQGNLVRWRVRAEEPGTHNLTVALADGTRLAKTLVVGDGTPRLAKVRQKESLGRLLLNPAEEPLPQDSPVASVQVSLPRRELDYGLFRTSWLIALIIFSLVAGLALKDVFKVRL
jgi:hypothetical protein|nr:hypothetical protein [Candidatus Krumholzibacteria bacterium]